MYVSLIKKTNQQTNYSTPKSVYCFTVQIYGHTQRLHHCMHILDN